VKVTSLEEKILGLEEEVLATVPLLPRAPNTKLLG